MSVGLELRWNPRPTLLPLPYFLETVSIGKFGCSLFNPVVPKKPRVSLAQSRKRGSSGKFQGDCLEHSPVVEG